MERWHHSRKAGENYNPSFSSTLLDAIYRSIDDRSEVMRSKQLQQPQQKRPCDGSAAVRLVREEEANRRRALMIEKWIEKKVNDEVAACRSAAVRPATVDFDKRSRRCDLMEFPFIHSSSSSSDSSSGGGFSSSEADSIYGANFDPQRAAQGKPEKPRKEFHPFDGYSGNGKSSSVCTGMAQKPNHGGEGLNKTKSKALKMYRDLKKTRQPISPGSKLAGFIHSLFSTPGDAKRKPNPPPSSSLRKNKGDRSSSERTCSSASSFSRSCLSKTSLTATTREKPSAVEKTVRFVDDEPRPRGSGFVPGLGADSTTGTARNSINEELNARARETSRRVEEAARDLLKMRQQRQKDDYTIPTDLRPCADEESDEDGDDAASCSSSDLFELDNLSAIGADRYREELPVYETTHPDANTKRAIAGQWLDSVIP